MHLLILSEVTMEVTPVTRAVRHAKSKMEKTIAGDFFISGVELLYRSEFLYPCARALNMFELAAA